MLSFEVKGSTGNIYTVTFDRTDDNLKATCTCAAGQAGKYCYHRFYLMDGDTSQLVSDNADDVKLLPDMIEGTDVAKCMVDVIAAAKQYEDAKKALAKAMAD